MERRSIQVVEPCDVCGREDVRANVTSIVFWDVWFCSKACYKHYCESVMGHPTLTQFYYLVEQQKEVLSLAKQFENTTGLGPPSGGLA